MNPLNYSLTDIASYLINNNLHYKIAYTLGVAGAGYLLNRYTSTKKSTSTQIIIDPDPTNQKYNNLYIQNTLRKPYIVFWNGNFQSTYFLIQLLKNDCVVLPIYINKYNISKTVIKEDLMKIVKATKNNKSAIKDFVKNNEKEAHHLGFLKLLMDKQTKERIAIRDLRLMILEKYPEFTANFLPTMIVTNIEKDLDHTTDFNSAVNSINIIHKSGVEIIEQITRFVKNYEKNKKYFLALNQSSTQYDLTSNIIKVNPLLFTNIDLPLFNLSNDDIKQTALNENFYFILQKTTNFVKLVE